MGIDSISLHVADRVRTARQLRRLSENAFAAQLGVSQEQVQDYETGACALSAHRLYEIARLLQVQIDFFYEGLSDDTSASLPASDARYEALKRAVRRIAADHEVTAGGCRKKMPLCQVLQVARETCDLFGWSYGDAEDRSLSKADVSPAFHAPA